MSFFISPIIPPSPWRVHLHPLNSSNTSSQHYYTLEPLGKLLQSFGAQLLGQITEPGALRKQFRYHCLILISKCGFCDARMGPLLPTLACAGFGIRPHHFLPLSHPR
jgi:hypothetical protein